YGRISPDKYVSRMVTSRATGGGGSDPRPVPRSVPDRPDATVPLSHARSALRTEGTTADELTDKGRGRQARVGRARPGGEGGGPGAAGRRHGGHLHGAAPDAGTDRRDRDPGGRTRGRAVRALRRSHDPLPSGDRAAAGTGC